MKIKELIKILSDINGEYEIQNIELGINPTISCLIKLEETIKIGINFDNLPYILCTNGEKVYFKNSKENNLQVSSGTFDTGIKMENKLNT